MAQDLDDLFAVLKRLNIEQTSFKNSLFAWHTTLQGNLQIILGR